MLGARASEGGAAPRRCHRGIPSRGLSTTLDEVGDGGGWQEGVGYWRYMLGTSMEFGDALKRVTERRKSTCSNIRKSRTGRWIFRSIPICRRVEASNSGIRATVSPEVRISTTSCQPKRVVQKRHGSGRTSTATAQVCSTSSGPGAP